jgi:hypothetical protein
MLKVGISRQTHPNRLITKTKYNPAPHSPIDDGNFEKARYRAKASSAFHIALSALDKP